MFRRLQEKFDGLTRLPIEIQDICDALVELGCQDEIRVVDEDIDTNSLLGMYVQWREQQGPYVESKSISLIIYPRNTSLYMQRLICAKELVHVCDNTAAKVKDPEEILELANALSRSVLFDGGQQIANAKVATDVLAALQAQMLLFPRTARFEAREKIASNDLNLEQLVERLQLPPVTVEEMLKPGWEDTAVLLNTI